MRRLQSAKLAGNWVVTAVNISTFRHEIAVTQQLRSVLPQEPLNRRRASLMGPDVDVADAFLHAPSILSPSIELRSDEWVFLALNVLVDLLFENFEG